MDFVVLEGTDGTGKSSLGVELGRRGFHIVESPPEPFRTVKPMVLTDAKPLARLSYFMAGNLQVGGVKQLGVLPTIAIRYLWSTVAYHAAIEGLTVDEVLRYAEPFLPSLQVPDLTIMLKATRDQQVLRLTGRREDELQARLAASSDFQESLEQAFGRVAELVPWPSVTIDTSDRPFNEVAMEVVKIID